MSDNITREPYRNAWYKQLQEEMLKVTPHLVPEVENDDNGKILVAGQEGTFGWAQPPEELPVITESDEGKVLKVDEGVPKWLEDQDAEIPAHTASDEGKMLSINAHNNLEWKDVPNEDLFVYITQSGTSPNFTYTADHTYAEIKSAIQNGKNVYVRLAGTNNIYQLFIFSDTVCTFAHLLPNHLSTYNDTENARILANCSDVDNDAFVIRANGVIRSTIRFCIQHLIAISVASDTLSDRAYWYITNVPVSVIDYNGYRLNLYYKDSTVYKFRDIANTYECVIDVSTKTYTIETIQGGSPHYAEVSLGISVE